jgi:hypothetical protein
MKPVPPVLRIMTENHRSLIGPVEAARVMCQVKLPQYRAARKYVRPSRRRSARPLYVVSGGAPRLIRWTGGKTERATDNPRRPGMTPWRSPELQLEMIGEA